MEQAGGVDNLRKQADMAQTSRPCDGCGKDVPRTRPTGVIPRFCGESCKPRCSVPDCGQAVRKRGWCASHYAQQRITGEPPRSFVRKWAEREMLCRVCANPVPAEEQRRFLCSGACEYLWRRNNGKVPAFQSCVSCAAKIDLTKRGKGGQRVRRDVKLCRRCRQDKRKHGFSVTQLAERDGLDCGICGEAVDLTIRRSDPDGLMCASVDHIIPRARGGTNDPSNLQLAHLLCNHRKSDRMDSVA